MTNLWNQRDLRAPALFALKSKGSLNDLRSLKTLLQDSQYFFSNMKSFETAAAYCSRLIARTCSQFRSSHGIKALKKTNTALLRYKQLDISITIDNILGSFPTYIIPDIDIELPSRQYFEYFLVKLQGQSKLMCRIVNYAKEATEYYLTFLQLGHFMELTTLIISILAQIWKLGRDICKKTVHLYNKLMPLQQCFSKGKKPFMKDMALPHKLDEWLGSDWTDIINIKENLKILKRWKQTQSNEVFDLIDFNDEDDGTEQKLENDEKEKSEITTNPKDLLNKPSIFPVKSNVDEEIGVPVERVTFPQNHNPNVVVNKNSLKQFLKAENTYRLKKNKKSLTFQVPQFEWENFQSRIEKQIKIKSDKDSVKLFHNQWKLLVR